MRLLLSSTGAVFITLMLFYIMIGFVRTDALPPIESDSASIFKVEKLDQGKDQKKQKTVQKKLPKNEPTPELNTQLMSDVTPDLNNIDIRLNMHVSTVPLEMAELPKLQQNWVQPTSLDTSSSSQGLDGDITSEQKSMNTITPVGTRTPIIPKVAWDNKINGWVLLSFTVTSEGRVKDIRVLDASPKGVFEENAVLAASKWRYQGFIGYDRYVSQKIEFEWKNYPYNWDY